MPQCIAATHAEAPSGSGQSAEPQFENVYTMPSDIFLEEEDIMHEQADEDEEGGDEEEDEEGGFEKKKG